MFRSLFMLLFLITSACSAHKLTAALPPVPALPTLLSPIATNAYVELGPPQPPPLDVCPGHLNTFRTNEFVLWVPWDCFQKYPRNMISVINRTSGALVLSWDGSATVPRVHQYAPGPDGIETRLPTVVFTTGPGGELIPEGAMPPCDISYIYQVNEFDTMTARSFTVPVGTPPSRSLIDGDPVLVLNTMIPGPDGPSPVPAFEGAHHKSQPNQLGKSGGNVIEFVETGACPNMN